jgi:menaquinone-dependent protoporphyrinogen oxidase
MNTAIIFTSKHGTTAKVAQMIAERLTGHQVSIIDLKKDKHPDIHSFDGIILENSTNNLVKLCRKFVKDHAMFLF